EGECEQAHTGGACGKPPGSVHDRDLRKMRVRQAPRRGAEYIRMSRPIRSDRVTTLLELRSMMFGRAARVAGAVLFAAAGAGRAQPLTNPDGRDDVFYQFMPIAWRDSNNDAQRFGDFGGMTASLDYLQALGVTAVWMNPIFPTNAYHGYQHGAADQVNSRLGTEARFLAFVSAAHARGIKVFLDYVAYGISQNSTWFASAYNNPASPYDTWLAFTNAANTQYTGSVYTTWNGQSVGFIHWNLADANPVNLDITWARHWLDP